MEFLKFARKRSFLSEVVYTALNVGLAIAVLLVVLYTQSIWFAIAVVILSKWRVFAVRPRFWWANLQSNLVDFIVSVSVVVVLLGGCRGFARGCQSLFMQPLAACSVK